MKSRMWIPYLALFLLFSSLGSAWAAEDQAVDVRLQPVTIKGKQKQATTIVDVPSWAVIPDAGSEPESKTPSGGSNPDSQAPQAGQNPRGQTPQMGVDPHDPVPQWGVSPTDELPQDGRLPPVQRPAPGIPSSGTAPQQGETPAVTVPNAGGKPIGQSPEQWQTPENLLPGAAGPLDRSTLPGDGVRSGTTPAVEASPTLPTSWWGRLAEHVNGWKSIWQDKQADIVDIGGKIGRGILAGAIGAVALTLFVVGVMALVGTTITGALLLPLLGVALSFGIAFGIGYSFVAGESFRFWKGAVWGAIGAGIGITLLYAGVGTVLQSGLQLLRGAMGRLVAHPVSTLRGTLTNKWTIWSFGSNMAWNSYVYWDENGKLPRTAREWSRIVLGSLISTLVFDRFSRFLSVQKIKQWQQRVLQAITGMADTAVNNQVMPKGEHTASGYLAGLTANLTFKPSIFGKWLERMRKKQNIGTTVDELRLLGVTPRTMPTFKKQKRKATNKMLQNLYHMSAEDSAKVMGYLRQQQGVISKNQMKLLKENQAKYERFLIREKGVELAAKYAERKLDSALSRGTERLGLNNRLTGVEEQAEKGERLR